MTKRLLKRSPVSLTSRLVSPSPSFREGAVLLHGLHPSIAPTLLKAAQAHRARIGKRSRSNWLADLEEIFRAGPMGAEPFRAARRAGRPGGCVDRYWCGFRSRFVLFLT